MLIDFVIPIRLLHQHLRVHSNSLPWILRHRYVYLWTMKKIRATTTTILLAATASILWYNQ
jgi:hypothetical protein